MKSHLLILLVPLAAAGCRELSFVSHRSSSSDDAGVDGDDPATGVGTGGGGVSASDFFPGFDTPDAAAPQTNIVDGIALALADAGAFSITPPWGADAGADPASLATDFPDPSSLPPASALSAALALSIDDTTPDAGTDAGPRGCGEPPTCYLRTAILTRQGHVYSARFSNNYPKDSCVTKVVTCDQAVLVGDSNGRFGDPICGSGTPQITFGFLVPQQLLFGWSSGQVWESASGFKSEWTLADAGEDSGSYQPAPGFTSKLWPLWSRFFAGGEVYGEMIVPLRNSTTQELALGLALFDIRVRP
jgi:hypothetical protein